MVFNKRLRDRDDAILHFAHAFTQTLLLRNTQPPDDTYVRYDAVETETWWLLTTIRPQAWFLTLLTAGAIMGWVATIFMGMLVLCGFTVRYTGEWRPVQLEGPEEAHIHPNTVVQPKEEGLEAGVVHDLGV
eukprot:TRINITY_DN6322_c0_g4_i4.p3 TRINITY_DN6322_c0_g4~~TRINITY_DN6322_c0_g4_i4.p3  ORF type:complete len:131 (+),score=10.72 TRINITY_DN6322_c0_g4_i4:1839-2231(+)